MLSKNLSSLLDLDDMIINPFTDEKVEEAMGLSQIKTVIQILENQNRNETNFNSDIEFKIKGKKSTFRVTAKALWSSNDVSNPTTIIGKVHVK